MKLLILSDLHANLPALEAVWQAEGDADLIYCGGDLVDYGDDPHGVIEWCREHHVLSVKGNHDADVVEAFRDPEGVLARVGEAEFRWIRETCAQLTEDDIAYLDILPQVLDFTADGYRYRLTHKFNYPLTYVCPRYAAGFDAFVKDVPADMPFRLILGHTHRQTVFTLPGDRVWMNPGSTSFRQADDPDISAHYAVIKDGKISLRSAAFLSSPALSEMLSEAEVYLQDKEAHDIDC